MAKQDRSKLPAPYDGVTMSYVIEGRCVRCWYSGPADQLVASGAAEPHMLEPGVPGKTRQDSRGHYFRRQKIGPDRYRVFRCIDDAIEDAVNLPAVPPELIRSEAEKQDHEPAQCAEATERSSPGFEDSAAAAKLLERALPGVTVELFRRFLLRGEHVIALTGEQSLLLSYGLIRECHVPPGRKRYLYLDTVSGEPDHINRVAGGALRLRIEVKGDLPTGHPLESFAPSYWPFFESEAERRAHFQQRTRNCFALGANEYVLASIGAQAATLASKAGLTIHPSDTVKWERLAADICDRVEEFVSSVRIQPASRPKLRLIASDTGTCAGKHA